MRRPQPTNALDVLLKQCYTRPSSRCLSAVHKRRTYSTDPTTTPKPTDEQLDIGVLGGGITGLATAFYISQELPKAKVTVYEAANNVGGWLQTEKIPVEGGHVLFEYGPRTLRPSLPNGLVMLDLVSVSS